MRCPNGHQGGNNQIIRQLKPVQFERLHQELIKKAHADPLEASYNIDITINGQEYAVRLQPENHCKIAVLQAFRIYREPEGPCFELIIENGILSSLLEILIYQGI